MEKVKEKEKEEESNGVKVGDHPWLDSIGRNLISVMGSFSSFIEEKKSVSRVPFIAGNKNNVYHTPNSFGWTNSDAAQGYSLYIPKGYPTVKVQGYLSVRKESSSKDASSTILWSLFVKRQGDDAKAVSSGSFDVENGVPTISRQTQFYRKVSENKVPLFIGLSQTELNQCEGGMLMLWLKPVNKSNIEISDNLEFVFEKTL
eukprot:c10219_g1_i1.p1 GENE.c10219_g1_i1~~c10219_g1_i1.p1  ORF type:complete len:209 (-),score=85.00 c10219_g1_i1:22-627(-)